MSGNVPQSQLPNIELSATVAGVKQTWTGKVIRAEGVDAGTQQLNVIARVDRPFAPGKPPLRIGQYVEATIAGSVLEGVFVLPRSALREDREVLLLNKDSQIERREVVVAWADEQTAAISDGLEDGSILVTTPLSTVTNGTPVRAAIDGEPAPRREGRPEGEGKPGGNGKWKSAEGTAEGVGGGGQGKRGDAQGERAGRKSGEAKDNGGDDKRGDAQGKDGEVEPGVGQGKGGQGKRGDGQRKGSDDKRNDGHNVHGDGEVKRIDIKTDASAVVQTNVTANAKTPSDKAQNPASGNTDRSVGTVSK